MSASPDAAAAARPGPQSQAKPAHPLRVPHFRNLWMGSAVSLFGDQFYIVALPWLVLNLTGSSLALGTILMSAAVPRALLMLMGGAVTDRFSSKRVLMTTASTRTILVAAVALLAWLHIIHLWHIYVLAFLFGTADAFGFPAGAALMPTLVAPEQLPAANSMFQSTAQLSGLLGPGPAGVIVKRWGVAQAFLIDAISFLFVLLPLSRLPESSRPAAAPGAPRRPSMLHSIGEGLRYVKNDTALRALILLAAAMNFCIAGPVAVGLATIAKFHFGSAAAYGTLLSCFSGGALAGMVLAGVARRAPRRGVLLMGLAFFLGAALLSLGISQRFASMAVTLALMGVGGGFTNVQIAAWAQGRVERQMMGRVMSVLMFSAVGLLPISLVIAGAVAQLHVSAMFLTAGALLLLVAVVTAFTPAVREIN